MAEQMEVQNIAEQAKTMQPRKRIAHFVKERKIMSTYILNNFEYYHVKAYRVRLE